VKRFSRLVIELAETRRTSAKVALLENYLREAPAADVAHVLGFLVGRRRPRRLPTRRLREWLAESIELPEWLVAACHEHVGDLAETLAILAEDVQSESATEVGCDDDGPSLDDVMQRYVLAPDLQVARTAQPRIIEAWRRFDRDERFVLHKLLGGGFRMGVGRALVIEALARVAEVDPAVMAHRLAGDPRLDAARVTRLLSGVDDTDDAARPYPLALATPIELAFSAGSVANDPAAITAALGDVSDWQIEPKWDGIRGQLVRRGTTVALWSRHDEPIDRSFPEIVGSAAGLSHDVVLDGEVIAVEDAAPRPFAELQRRLGTTRVEPMLFGGTPVAFIAFDLLELDGVDLRSEALEQRRHRLETLLRDRDPLDPIRLGPIVEVHSWSTAAEVRAESRRRRIEGLVVKRRSSPYRGGRVRGDWWKWKIDPFTADLVMTAARLGHGRRAGLYTDYTLAAWTGRDTPDDPRRLVTVASAYSGLEDREISTLDAWIRRSTVGRRGPVRLVEPTVVMEVAFEAVRESDRHRGGIALRFPRIVRIRADKRAEEADEVGTIAALVDPASVADHADDR
jgi:DNA ligase-1